MPPPSQDPHDLVQTACREMEEGTTSKGVESDIGPAERRLREMIDMGTPSLPADFNSRLLQKWRDVQKALPSSSARQWIAQPGAVWREVRQFIGVLLTDRRQVVAVALVALLVLIGVHALIERPIEPRATPESRLEVAMSPARGAADGGAGVGAVSAGMVFADWHVTRDADLETGRFVTWPKEARGTVRVEIPGLDSNDRELLHLSLYIDNPGEEFNLIVRNMRPGVSVASAERWAGVRVRIAPFFYPGGEAALWKKYPSGLHIRLVATG